MLEIRKSHAPYIVAGVLVLGALLFRLLGVTYDYPLVTHPDEGKLVEKPLSMLETGDLNPHFFNYPTLQIYLNAAVFRVMQAAPPDHKIGYYIAARVVVVLMSLITLVAVFFLAKMVFDWATGLAAVAILAMNPLHFQHSFYATVDAPQAMWTTLAVLFCVLLFREKRLAYYVGAGICVGFAIGTKYTAAVAVLPLVFAHFYQVRNAARWADWHLLVGLGLVPVAFLLSTPYALLDAEAFRAALAFEREHYRSGHLGVETQNSTSYKEYFDYLATEGLGRVGVTLVGVGLLTAFFTHNWLFLVLALYPLAHVFFIGQYQVWFPRNLLSAIPFVALFAAVGAVWLANLPARIVQEGRRGLVAGGLLVILLIVLLVPHLVHDVKVLRSYTIPDTRYASLKWILENIPEGSTIHREPYTPPIDEFSDKYDSRNLGYQSLVRYGQWADNYDYFVISSATYGRYLRDAKLQEPYKAFFERHHLIKEFRAGERMKGPTVRIYQMVD